MGKRWKHSMCSCFNYKNGNSISRSRKNEFEWCCNQLIWTAVGEYLRTSTWSPELQIVGLEEGDKVTVRDLLRAVLVYSGCDAAEALAEYYPGGKTYSWT